MRSTLAVLIAAVALVGCDYPAGPVQPTPQASRITFSATPSSVLRSGSTVTITGALLDTAGVSMPSGTPVTFSTTAGTLSESASSVGQAGLVQVRLTSSAPATVTASAGEATGTIDITAIDPFSLSLVQTVTPGTAGESLPIIVTVRRANLVDAPAPETVTLTCNPGDPGNAIATTGGISGCTFRTAGSHTVTARAAAANGFAAHASLSAVVADPVEPVHTTPAPSVAELHAGVTCTAGDVGDDTTCTVSGVTYGSTPIGSNAFYVRWDFGDQVTVEGDNSKTHVYTQAGVFTVVAQVVANTASGEQTTTVSTNVTIDP